LAKQRAVKTLGFIDCNSRPETGSLNHPVAEAATSCLDILKLGALSKCSEPGRGGLSVIGLFTTIDFGSTMMQAA